MDDTITAISTSLGIGAISIVRVSGNDAISIVNKIFKGSNLLEAESHTIHYGKIVENGEDIDEVLVSIMKSPRTFTRDDVVEINCHGGIMTTNRVLELLLTNGCRLAEPGEFTKRAYLNGRIDLTEAEGIMDLIEAKTENQRKMAINQVSGKVSSLIKDLREDMASIIANIEVNIDYPEYEDIEVVTNEMIKEKVGKLEEKVKTILKESEQGKLIKEGIKTSIIGKPNVGKSSLLNNLLEEEKAIVTEIEGTTRDIVEGTLNVDGILLNIIDTAGIRETDNIVEKIGVEKSLNLIDSSELILFVLNNNEEISKEELELLEKIKEKNHIIIINKIDLDRKIDIEKLESENIVYMSNLNNIGVEKLKENIKKLFDLEKIETSDLTYLSNARSISILKKSLELIKDVNKGLEEDRPVSIIEIDIKNIWNLLGEITGDIYDDELVDYLFSHFCLGK